jgi:hypothetical protein
VGVVASGQADPAQPALASSPKVEVKGVIEKVQIAPGQGMPFLELKGEKGTQRVMLGSMRYLLEQNFNPTAGSTALVKGFQVGDAVIARSVEIPAEKITIQLRDENGVPLWRGGRYGSKKQ